MISLAIFVWIGLVSLPQSDGADLPVFHCTVSPTVLCGGTADIWAPLVHGTWSPTGEICFQSGGDYAVSLQMGFAPGSHGARGSIYFGSNYPPRVPYSGKVERDRFLLGWELSSFAYTMYGNTAYISADPGECFRLSYSSTADAVLNGDSRATRLTIYKL